MSQKGREAGWIALFFPKQLLPAIRDLSQAWIERRAEGSHQRGQRIAKVAVLANSKSVLLHLDSAAEMVVDGIQTRHLVTLIRCQQARQSRMSAFAQRGFDVIPIVSTDAREHAGRDRGRGTRGAGRRTSGHTGMKSEWRLLGQRRLCSGCGASYFAQRKPPLASRVVGAMRARSDTRAPRGGSL